MRYSLLIREWSLSFNNLDTNEGYSFEGKKLNVEISPKAKVQNEAGGENELFDSTLNLYAESFTFGEITSLNKADNENVHPLEIKRIISQIYSNLPQGAGAGAGAVVGGSPSAIPNNDTANKFINIFIRHRWAKINEPKSTTLQVNLNGAQIVLDREIIKGFYKFLSGDIISVVKQDVNSINSSPSSSFSLLSPSSFSLSPPFLFPSFPPPLSTIFSLLLFPPAINHSINGMEGSHPPPTTLPFPSLGSLTYKIRKRERLLIFVGD